MSRKIQKGDQVIVLRGPEKGRTGEVIEVLPSDNRALVRGFNMVKRHSRRSAQTADNLISKESEVRLSNLALANVKSTLKRAPRPKHSRSIAHHVGPGDNYNAEPAAELRKMALSIFQSIAQKLGGTKELGTTISSDADLARLVSEGIRLSALGHIERAGFSKQEIERFVIPARTLRHRKARQEPLTLDESDRVIRLTRIQSMAEDVFADSGNANVWLRAPLGILDGKAPLEVARSEAGARVIEQILARIDWGAAA